MFFFFHVPPPAFYHHPSCDYPILYFSLPAFAFLSWPALPPALLPLVFELAFPPPLGDVLVFLAAAACARTGKP